jgi:uncharacterized protein YhjY with autotransporter beta-barrel domain
MRVLEGFFRERERERGFTRKLRNVLSVMAVGHVRKERQGGQWVKIVISADMEGTFAIQSKG